MTQVLFNPDTGASVDTLAPDAGEYDDPFFNLIFIAVHGNPNQFSFLNKLDTRLDFKWSRWQPFKHVLQPMTFHCFLVKGYKTKTSSGHGFTPVQHVAEFPGIHAARVYNAEYLHRWQEFANEDARTITKATREFVAELDDFAPVHAALLNVLTETAERHFMTAERHAVLQAALVGAEPPEVNLDDIVDTSELLELLSTLSEDW